MDIDVKILVERDDAPVRGNAMASGDDAFDKKVENEILARLRHGDVWAWANVTVQVWRKGSTGPIGEDHLGTCSYEGEADFRADPYFQDMVDQATADLHDKLVGSGVLLHQAVSNLLRENTNAHGLLWDSLREACAEFEGVDHGKGSASRT